MLILENITFSIGEVCILQNLCCSLHAGDFAILQGANGSGKSTFFDILMGRRRSQTGRIWADGIDITGWPQERRANLVGRMSQNTLHGCFPSMTVAENIVLAHLKNRRSTLRSGARGLPKPFLEEVSQRLDMDLESLMDRRMEDLSGGQRQTLNFLMVMLGNPKILLLDEPTAALDPTAAEKFVKFMTNYVETTSITTIMVTHDAHLLNTLGNVRWRLAGGLINADNDLVPISGTGTEDMCREAQETMCRCKNPPRSRKFPSRNP